MTDREPHSLFRNRFRGVKTIISIASFLLFFFLARNFFLQSGSFKRASPETLNEAHFVWKNNDIIAYKFHQEVQIALDLSLHDPSQITDSTPGLQKDSTQHESLLLAGTLFVRVEEISDKNVILRMGFQDISATASGHQNHLLESLYREPFLANFSPEGIFLKAQLSNEIAADDEERITGILEALQVTLPDAPSSAHWTVKEKDSLGEYVAKYTVLEREQVQREKLEYLKVSSSQSYYDDVRILSSLTQFRPSPIHSWFQQFKMENSQKLILLDQKQGEAKNKLSLQYLSEEQRTSIPDWLNISRKQFEDLLIRSEKKTLSPLTARFDQEKRDEILQSGKNIVSLSRALTGELSPSEILTRVSELREFLRLFPDKTNEVVNLLLKDPYTGDAGAHLVYALQGAGTGEAENALVEIASSAGFSDINRRRAVAALGQIPASSPSVDALWTLTGKHEEPIDDRLATMSILALGSISGHLQESHETERSDAIFNRIDTGLHEATSKNNSREMANYILALGNTFRDDAGPKIIPNLTAAESDEVRRASASALESITTPEVTNALVEQLLEEDVPEVRKKIVSSLTQREVTDETLVSVLQAALEEDDDATRRMMALYLKKGAETYPEIKEGLPQLVELETDPEIYRILSSTLNN